jgi:hypothetical protein
MATATAPVVPKAKHFNYEALKKSIVNHPGAWVLAVAFAGGFFYLLDRSHWNAAIFQRITADNILGFLMPAVVTSAIIERAVEVVVSPWRDPEADKRQNAVNNASTLLSAAPDNTNAAESLQAATDDLSQYTGQTRKYAYALAVAFSVMAVTAGVRVLWPMLDATAVQNLPVGQQDYFRWFDMLISALLLAGGAAGIHAPINAITSFFQKNS